MKLHPDMFEMRRTRENTGKHLGLPSGLCIWRQNIGTGLN